MPREPQPSDRSDHPEADYGCVRKRRHHLRVGRSGPPEGPAHHAAFSPRSATRLRPRWPKPGVARAPWQVDGAAGIESPQREKRARDVPVAGRACARSSPRSTRASCRPSNLQNTARLIGAFGIFSLGLGLVIITGGIDLSVGSAFALLGVLLSIMLTEWHIAWPVAVLITPRARRAARRAARSADHPAGAAAVHRHALRAAALSRTRPVHRQRRDEGVW